MSIFTDPNPEIIEENIELGDAMELYPDRFMIATNFRTGSPGIRGDIIAVLSPDEYLSLEKPNPMAPKFNVWVGTLLKRERVGLYGFVMPHRSKTGQ
jgi:hypothetical protein